MLPCFNLLYHCGDLFFQNVAVFSFGPLLFLTKPSFVLAKGGNRKAGAVTFRFIDHKCTSYKCDS